MSTTISSNQLGGDDSEVATRGMLEFATGRIFTKLQSAMSVHEAHVEKRMKGLEEQLKKIVSIDRPLPSFHQGPQGQMSHMEIQLTESLQTEMVNLRNQNVAAISGQSIILKQMEILRKDMDSLKLGKSTDTVSNELKPAEADLLAEISTLKLSTDKMLQDQSKMYNKFGDSVWPLDMPALENATKSISQDWKLYNQVHTIELDCSTITLGVEVNGANGQSLVISKINAGMMWEWNARNSGKQINVGDEILQVNNVSGSSARLTEELGKRKKSIFVIGSHTFQSQCIFDIELDHRHNTPLGLEIDSRDGETLSIESIGTGLVQEWNDSCMPDEKVKPGDRIIAINKATGSCVLLLEALRSQEVLRMSVASGPGHTDI